MAHRAWIGISLRDGVDREQFIRDMLTTPCVQMVAGEIGSRYITTCLEEDKLTDLTGLYKKIGEHIGVKNTSFSSSRIG